MEEEIINSLIQLGAAVVITYVIYLIIKEVLNFKNGGKNNKDNLSYQQATNERLDITCTRARNTPWCWTAPPRPGRGRVATPAGPTPSSGP